MSALTMVKMVRASGAPLITVTKPKATPMARFREANSEFAFLMKAFVISMPVPAFKKQAHIEVAHDAVKDVYYCQDTYHYSYPFGNIINMRAHFYYDFLFL